MELSIQQRNCEKLETADQKLVISQNSTKTRSSTNDTIRKIARVVLVIRFLPEMGIAVIGSHCIIII
jgi:hypothetical protein